MAEYDANEILLRMLNDIPSSIDKREGSVVYTTLSPVAVSLASAYYMYAYTNNLMFADEAIGEWLDRVCKDVGITREAATNAVRQINTYNSSNIAFDVPIGSRFAISDITLTVTEKIATGQFKASCDQTGTIGNSYSGQLLPVDNINGLGSAELVSAPLITARDQESDDSLRTRYYSKFKETPFGGNKADYRQKVLSITGVGAVEVFSSPDLAQPGHVGLVIGDEQGKRASQALIDLVQAEMGLNGDGIAPIGHTVAVGTSVDLAINVDASVKLKSGASFAIVKPIVEQTITDYIDSVGFNDPIVFYAKLVADILNCSDSIVDIGTVTMNGGTANIILGNTYANYEVPIVGTITVTEVTT